MKNISVNELIKLSSDEQWKWVKLQYWYNNEEFVQSLYEAKVTAMAVPNLEENLIEYLTNYKDYGSSSMLKDKGFISIERENELEELGNFTELEKTQLKECLVDDALDNCDVHEARTLSFTLDNKNILVTFQGSNHPQGGFDANFLGIFETEIEIEKAMSNIGVVIDNFLASS